MKFCKKICETILLYFLYLAKKFEKYHEEIKKFH